MRVLVPQVFDTTKYHNILFAIIFQNLDMSHWTWDSLPLHCFSVHLRVQYRRKQLGCLLFGQIGITWGTVGKGKGGGGVERCCTSLLVTSISGAGSVDAVMRRWYGYTVSPSSSSGSPSLTSSCIVNASNLLLILARLSFPLLLLLDPFCALLFASTRVCWLLGLTSQPTKFKKVKSMKINEKRVLDIKLVSYFN